MHPPHPPPLNPPLGVTRGKPPPPLSSLVTPLQKMITRQEFDYKLRKFTALMKSFEKVPITACYHTLKVTDIFVKLNRMQCKKQKVESDFDYYRKTNYCESQCICDWNPAAV